MDEIDPEQLAPPYEAPERQMLEGWLDFHRATLLYKCRGLDPDQLAARSVPPATLSLLGLVRHMSEVERHWFCRVLLGERVVDRYCTKEARDADFDGAAPGNAAEGLANFAVDCERSRQVVSGAGSLDQRGARQWRGATVSLRWILVHMIEEYARHNGHADLLRQCIDGAVG
jgi:uncharacterized damage-inducible protein DinB